MTGAALPSPFLVAHHALRKLVREWEAEHSRRWADKACTGEGTEDDAAAAALAVAVASAVVMW